MRTMTVRGLANAVRAGVKASWNDVNQLDALQSLFETFLDMAISLEMEVELIAGGPDRHLSSSIAKQRQLSDYADLLGAIALELEESVEKAKQSI